MGMEVPGADVAVAPAKLADAKDMLLQEKDLKTDIMKGHEKEAVVFGTENSIDQSDGDANKVNHVDHVAPKDASAEWPEEKQIYTYYFIRYRSYEDPKLREKIEQAAKDLQKKTEIRSQVLQALRDKRSERGGVIAKLKPLSEDNKQYNLALNERIKKMEPLQNELGAIRSQNNAARDRSAGLCSSEDELNALIKSMEYRINHESIPLDEEKRILKEIKQLESTRSKVIASAAVRTQLKASDVKKEALQDQVKLIGADLDEVRKERQAVRAKIKVLEDELNVIDEQIAALEADLTSATAKKDKAYETMQELRKSRELSNLCFHQNRAFLNHVKELGARNEAKQLQELSHSELEKFMSQWNKSKDFREDYEKRIIGSLNYRQLSRDGRMRNSDEKPIVEAHVQTAAVEVPSAASKAPAKQAKEAAHSTTQPASHSANEKHSKEIDQPVDDSLVNKRDSKETSKNEVTEKPSKEVEKPKEVDPEKLRAMRREEEIAKNKLALERKKKAAERKATLAAAAVQKEAEKKQKKKSIKKGAPPSESEEQSAEDDQKSDNPVEKLEDEHIQSSAEKPKEAVRKRVPAKNRGQLPRVLIKRKKSQGYWSYAAPVAGAIAAVLVVALAIFTYYNYRTVAAN